MSLNPLDQRNRKIPTRQLFPEIALHDKDKKRSEEAFNQFYAQFKNYVYTVCKDFLVSRGVEDKQHIKSFFNNVLVTIHQKSNKLEVPESVPESEVKYVICAIIGKFIRFEGLQYLRDLNPKESIDLDFIEIYNEEIKYEEITDVESIELRTLNQALDSLNDENRLILLECFRYDDENKNTPSKVLDELENHFGKNRDALRKVKSRAFNKVKEFILSSETMKTIKKT